MADDVVIKVEGLWKRYGLPLVPAVKGFANRLLGKPSGDGGPWALRDVSFEVKRGETLGIIGRNGAGKSTLLKILAGVTPPTRGKVEVRGRVFPMIELNAGIHMELTGRENVRLLGAIMGLTRKEIEAKMPEIEEFCELGEWFDKPVRMYSDGMLARLGFGVAMNIDAEILLIDEVLAVGDYGFRRKCIERFRKLQTEGITILFVSHNLYQIRRLCETSLVLHQGEILFKGSPFDSFIFYEKLTVLEQHDRIIDLFPTIRSGSGKLRITKVELENSSKQVVKTVYSGEQVTFSIHFVTFEPLTDPLFTILINNLDNIPITALISRDISHNLTSGVSGIIKCSISNFDLAPGTYTVDIKVGEEDRIDFIQNALYFQVLPNHWSTFVSDNVGFVVLRAKWEMERIVPKRKEIHEESHRYDEKIIEKISTFQKEKNEPYSNRAVPFKRGNIKKILTFLSNCKYIIDIGCGVGHTMKFLEEKGFEVIGITINEDEINNKVCRSPVYLSDIHVFETDQTFDAAIMWDVIEHLVAPIIALKQVNKLLKVGGKLVVYVPSQHWQECDYHIIVPTESQMRWLLNLSGFVILETENEKDGGKIYYAIKAENSHMQIKQKNEIPEKQQSEG